MNDLITTCHVLIQIHLLQLLMYISSSLTYNLTVILRPQYHISTRGEHRVLTFYSKMTQMILIRLKDMSSWQTSYEANINLIHNSLSFSELLKRCPPILHSYLTGAIAAQLWWHLSNMNMIQRIQRILFAKAPMFLMEISMDRAFQFLSLAAQEAPNTTICGAPSDEITVTTICGAPSDEITVNMTHFLFLWYIPVRLGGIYGMPLCKILWSATQIDRISLS